ncbi:MAG: hypothetical protein ACR2GY_13110 [Phycisphaerales bacterium]
MHMHPILRSCAFCSFVSVLLTLPGLMGGCTTRTETFSGYDSSAVWSAMVAAAENPTNYNNWSSVENKVTPNAETGVIHVYRELRRDVVHRGMKPRREGAVLEHEITMLTNDVGEPVVKFKSRHLDVPASAREEADAYFESVWGMLGGQPRRDDDNADDADMTNDQNPDMDELLDNE